MDQHISADGHLRQQFRAIVIAADDKALSGAPWAQVLLGMKYSSGVLDLASVGQLAPQGATGNTFCFQALDIQARIGISFVKYIAMAGNTMGEGNGTDLNLAVLPATEGFARMQVQFEG
ncbi:hypothetical protein D3C84_1082980 [compost metagenome]